MNALDSITPVVHLGYVKGRLAFGNTVVYNFGCHLIGCPKYRRKVPLADVEKRLRELQQEKAASLELRVKQSQIVPDHAPLFVKAPPTPPHSIVG